MTRPLYKLLWPLLLVALVVLVVADRARWADVAQWREDQACNLWIGYQQDPLAMPVGLISSVGAPNPNGMPLLAVALSTLPNLWAISTFLGIAQALLALWVAWLLARGSPVLFLIAALPLVASVVLRATSIELWNQWLLTSFNLLFFGLWISYLRRRSPWLIALMIAPILYAPALYLAGVVNAIVYVAFVALAVWLRPPQAGRKSTLAAVAFSGALLLASLWVTWLPYARAIEGEPRPVPELTWESGLERVVRAAESALDYPPWNLTHWYRQTEATFLQSSTQILRGRTVYWMHFWERLLLAQAALFSVTWIVSLAARVRAARREGTFFADGRAELGWLVLACMGFVFLPLVISPLLGGPAWAVGERPDQQVQLLPFAMLAWFLLPFTIRLTPRLALVLRGSSVVLAAAFTVSSFGNGWRIISNHLSYKGDVLSDADVPLEHRRQAVAFMVRDWNAIAPGQAIPVSYHVSEPPWLLDFGTKLNRWYRAPMTLGRAFDFELRRAYGLSNSQEGQQLRLKRVARYFVSYAFDKPPRVGRSQLTHHQFGRLRVSVRAPRRQEPEPARAEPAQQARSFLVPAGSP